jgi:hypothetical protein
MGALSIYYTTMYVSFTSIETLLLDMCHPYHLFQHSCRDRVAITKTDFNTLKAILKGQPVDEVNNAEKKLAVATAVAASSSTTTASTTTASTTEVVHSKSIKEAEVVHEAVEVVLSTTTGEEGEESSVVGPQQPLQGEEFMNTVAQFASTRSYTVFQAVQLMEIAMENTSLDSFDRINFAVILWKT